MQGLNILNSKQIKHVLELLKEQYGYETEKNDLDFIFMINKENRLYVISKNLGRIDFEKLRIDAQGLYFGELYDNRIRLSIEGCQIVGPSATKNLIDLDEKQMMEWVKGQDIEFTDTGKDFVIVRHLQKITGKYDILGCGKYKDGKLMNYVSKSRRLVVINI